MGTTKYGRELYFSVLASPDDWPFRIEKPKPYFVLFVAVDATRVPEASIRGFADKIADQGVAYVSAWGPGCSWVHDILDFALYVDNEELRRDADEHDSVIMTAREPKPRRTLGRLLSRVRHKLARRVPDD
jgi:hypothetical protein